MFQNVYALPDVGKILSEIPLSVQLKNKKTHFDKEIEFAIVSRSKFVVVCGPCSADDPDALHEYAQKLYLLQQRYTNLLIVLRVYTTKPHSTGVGFRGLCFQKAENSPCDIPEGIAVCRKMMIDMLQIGLPVADELLYTELFRYFSDIVSYWFVGARSSEDSLHRAFASGLDVPCGIKNPTNGLTNFATNNLIAVSRPCDFPFGGVQLHTCGNPLAHIVLRGGADKNGFFCNITPSETAQCKQLLRMAHLNDFVMADLSHANSSKVAEKQLENAVSVSRDVNVDGAMVESYLFAGSGPIGYGISRTDDCLDFASTEKLLDILSRGFAERAKF